MDLITVFLLRTSLLDLKPAGVNGVFVTVAQCLTSYISVYLRTEKIITVVHIKETAGLSL